MSGALAMARRELLSLFGTLVGWVVVALFLVPCGVVFAVSVFRNGQPATLRDVFAAAGWSMLFVAPAITMRSFSDELRLGTWETLAAAPIGEGAIVAGKFIAALAMIVAMVLPTLGLALALELHGRPDFGELACGALGVVLIGALFASVGLLASTLTASQLVAYLLALFFWLVLELCCRVLPPRAPGWLAELLYASDPLRRLRDFTLGLLDSAHVAYFTLLCTAALIGATWCVRARRIE
ncbi:MAG: ABC transporter permease subunit [Phycisphaerales bacterium]